MRAHLVLCDFAEQDQASGKVHILGAGWSVVGPQAVPQAVVVLIKVAWTEANRAHDVRVRLTDADGNLVAVPSTIGEQPMEIPGKLEVGRPASLPEGSEIDASFVVALQPLPLAGGQRYTWRLHIDGREEASESFFVRA
jgi:hypothetical protein